MRDAQSNVVYIRLVAIEGDKAYFNISDVPCTQTILKVGDVVQVGFTHRTTAIPVVAINHAEGSGNEEGASSVSGAGVVAPEQS